MALVEFSKHSRRGRVETVAHAHIEVELKIRIRRRSPIAEHKWFATFNFETMCAYKMTAPWVPKIKDALDCSNFEPYEGNDSIDSGYKDDPKLWVGFCT